jgi:LysM repeat protein
MPGLIADDPPSGGTPDKGKKILGMPRGVAIIGGFVLFVGIAWFYFKSKSSAASTAGTSADGSSGGSIIGYDSNGNPIYSAGGQLPADFSGEISTLQSEYGSLASEVSAQQGTTGPAGPAGPAGPPGPAGKAPAPKPAPKPKPKPKTTEVTVAKWTSHNAPWNSTLSGIAAHYHTTVANLLKLNPGIKNPNVIYAGQKVKVPT